MATATSRVYFRLESRLASAWIYRRCDLENSRRASVPLQHPTPMCSRTVFSLSPSTSATSATGNKWPRPEILRRQLSSVRRLNKVILTERRSFSDAQGWQNRKTRHSESVGFSRRRIQGSQSRSVRLGEITRFEKTRSSPGV